MSPIILGAIATAAGGALLLLVGWGLRDRGARRTEAVLCGALQRANITLHRANARADALEEELAVVNLNLADADEALQEYREAVPKAFDLGMEAGKHLAEHQLTSAAVTRAQRSNVRWN